MLYKVHGCSISEGKLETGSFNFNINASILHFITLVLFQWEYFFFKHITIVEQFFFHILDKLVFQFIHSVCVNFQFLLLDYFKNIRHFRVFHLLIYLTWQKVWTILCHFHNWSIYSSLNLNFHSAYAFVFYFWR